MMDGSSTHIVHLKHNKKRKNTAQSGVEIPVAEKTVDESSTDNEIKQNKSEFKPNKVKKVKPSSLWNFVVDYNDHFETPKVAYSDLTPMLNAFASAVNKSAGDLTIYDPYWCEGSMVEHLKELGFSKVINRNRDFYADVKRKAIPDHDVLVTNPPYSGEHKVKLLSFLAAHSSRSSSSSANDGVPFALLLPVYVATKSYWKDFAAQQARVGKSVFYLLPPDYYEYAHPEGTGKDTPPFYSAWFLGGFDTQQRERLIRALRETPRKALTAAAGNFPVGVKRLSFNTTQVAESLSFLVQKGLVVDAKRPNPKQRQKLRAKHTS